MTTKANTLHAMPTETRGNPFAEPSTYAALAAIVAMFRPDLAAIVPHVGDVVMCALGGIAGIVGVLKKG